ncbi:ferredoxin [Goodfellowiella coeruleoviolacea]|uniref:Ferredoxin n=1 Tax=Goodfellowiella coeruleoviolacea TaxID=334858 RepID=A0AAE3GHZ8_9PSEU|nr:ferredoxin [Goodfellowiella coeruleoviolacea]MCP2167988.1 ferredoxin [Goodfellowiella coeruleoviolacea]
MEIKADRERCVGAGMCVLTAPEVFDQSEDDGRVVLLTEHPEPDQVDTVQQAVELCPAQALLLAGKHRAADG